MSEWKRIEVWYCPKCGYHVCGSSTSLECLRKNYKDRLENGAAEKQKSAWQNYHHDYLPMDETLWLYACPFCQDHSQITEYAELKTLFCWNNQATEKQIQLLNEHYLNINYKNVFISKALAKELIMALPKFDKSQRRKNYEQLPKGAYVVKIMGAVQEPNRSGKGEHIKIIIEIAEGDFKGYFGNIYAANTNEDKKWPNDGTFYLTVPNDDSPGYVWTNYASFLADLEDSNPGYSFNQSIDGFRNKIIGGKFAFEQTEYNGRIYDHVKMRWTCVADDVRNGKPGKMPPDKLIDVPAAATEDEDGFMEIPDSELDGLPFR